MGLHEEGSHSSNHEGCQQVHAALINVCGEGHVMEAIERMCWVLVVGVCCRLYLGSIESVQKI